MIKVTYEQISGYAFTMAIQKLAAAPMQTRLAYAVKKLVDELTRARKRVSEEYQKEIVAEFAKKDADGKIIHPEGNQDAFDIDEAKKEDFMKAQDAFGKREVEINRYKLTLQDFVDSNLKLSPKEMADLEPLYEGEPDIVPENVKSIR